MIKVKLAILILVVMTARAADMAYIVGMYSQKERPGLGGYFLLKVDGKKVAKLRYSTYYRLEVLPGVYDITMDEQDRAPILSVTSLRAKAAISARG